MGYAVHVGIVAPTRTYPERRRWPRFPLELPVRVYCDPPPKVYEGRGRALNGGGMALSTAVALAVGDRIAVEFTLPPIQQPVTARCAVRNCNLQTYGVEFLAENDGDYRTIGQIEYNLSRLGDTAERSCR